MSYGKFPQLPRRTLKRFMEIDSRNTASKWLERDDSRLLNVHLNARSLARALLCGIEED
jgi:hypothetical protein